VPQHSVHDSFFGPLRAGAALRVAVGHDLQIAAKTLGVKAHCRAALSIKKQIGIQGTHWNSFRIFILFKLY
jgi:hypothetical protein